MESDHIKSDEKLLRIKSLIKEVENKNENPTEIISVIEEIKEFDKKFQFHLHIENNILFPKAIELEIELLKN
jgi:regulator of cell morphogenesis and NO signaling